jgi:murein DD-endopeptidase MepM/ murein hydrolase activator NlpD
MLHPVEYRPLFPMLPSAHVQRRIAALACTLLFSTALFGTALRHAAPTHAQEPIPPTETPLAPPPEQPPDQLPTATIPPPEFQPPAAETSLPIDPNVLPQPTITTDPNAPLPAEAPTAQIEIVATPLPPPPEPTSIPIEALLPNARIAQLGETLDSIGAQTGFSVSVLAAQNNLTRRDFLVANQKVVLPSEPSTLQRVHRLAQGETLFGLAAQYGISPFSLRAANALACDTCSVVGQLLAIPGVANQGSSLPAPFVNVVINPTLPKQGDVVVISVTTNTPLQSLVGTFGGRSLTFVQKDGTYLALSGVAAIQEPGAYSLTLRSITMAGVPEVIGGRVVVAAGQYGFEQLVVGPKLLPLLAPDVNAEERTALDGIYNRNFTGAQYWSGVFQEPLVSRIVSYYGTRRNFNQGTLNTFHSGIDLPARIGTPVGAAAPGKVIATQPFPIRGNVVIIDHGRGVFTVYCHLAKFNVEPGAIVNSGDVIGFTGNTGRSLGAHLHFEMAVGGVTVNPVPWLNKVLP